MHADILAEHWREAREGTRTREWFAEEVLPWLREEVGLLLEAGSRPGRDATARVCRDLLAIEPGLWTFASRAGVEPTNNAAERAVLRHGPAGQLSIKVGWCIATVFMLSRAPQAVVSKGFAEVVRCHNPSILVRRTRMRRRQPGDQYG